MRALIVCVPIFFLRFGLKMSRWKRVIERREAAIAYGVRYRTYSEYDFCGRLIRRWTVRVW